MILYSLLARVVLQRPAPANPRRVLLVLPCCIGDVIQATATLQALRRAYPQAHITWAVGSWSAQAITGHDMLDAVLDTGPQANPARTPGGLLRLARQLRAGCFDVAVSLVRSPLMGLALWLAGIPNRAGLDSAGRGFAYTVRVPHDPAARRHEAEIYLDVARALGLDTTDCRANVPVREADAQRVRERLAALGISGPYVVLNPAGGSNPGMEMSVKRWPPASFAALAARLAAELDVQPLLLAGPGDEPIVRAVQAHAERPLPELVGALTFGEIAALAREAQLYVGNDTGLTHLAAAAGGRAVMIFGPSDPARYAPFTPDSLALWQPSPLVSGGVAAGVPPGWTWKTHGIGLEDAAQRILEFARRSPA